MSERHSLLKEFNMKSKLLIITPLLLVLAGCVSTGNLALKEENTTTLQQKIVKGQTTKAEVITMFGEPQSRSIDNTGIETWIYSYGQSRPDAMNFVPYASLLASGSTQTTRTMTISFTKSGVVDSYSLDESQNKVRTGLLNQ